MKEKDFYEVVSAIAQFIERADNDGEVNQVGARYASPLDHEYKTLGRANPAPTENDSVNEYYNQRG